MGMAEVFHWPKQLILDLKKDPDEELTCLLCGRWKTDMTATWTLGGRRVVQGVHAKCVVDKK